MKLEFRPVATTPIFKLPCATRPVISHPVILLAVSSDLVASHSAANLMPTILSSLHLAIYSGLFGKLRRKYLERH